MISGFYLELAMKIMILALFALSLELLVGQTGLVCFGQAAFFGIGAYVVTLMSPQSEGASLWLALPAALGAAALFALVVGLLSLRTQGVYFIMITLAFAQMAYFVFHDTDLGGGSDGIYLYFRPVLKLGDWQPFDLDKPITLYYAVWACLAGTFVGLAVLLQSRTGRALAGIKANEQRMRAAGFSTLPYKLGAFVLSAVLAALAGFLFALKDGFVNPEILSWHFSGAVLIMIILGGLGHLRGALLGAAAFTLLQELFQSQALFGSFAKHWQLMLGLSIIAIVAFMPKGLVGLPALLGGRRARPAPEDSASFGATPASATSHSPEVRHV
ncbi:branched-chain amino acid ABC transporter permease [Ideonella sp. TBM-1]|uniref:Branched-chain amino acid ABC transporter permease n=1 Tax=Ideonella livida TaxID=2707176 RepID=A0A7C9PGL0_9BURK|nr:branched-chain amino acid ABC transporter permease [Ideonella livida]